MVVSGGRMKERNRFLATEGFNVQLKKRRTGTGIGTKYVTVGGDQRLGLRVKLARSWGYCRSCSSSSADSFSATNNLTKNKKIIQVTSPKVIGVTLQPTTYQKVRRILDEHADRQGKSVSRSKVHSPSSSSSSRRIKPRELGNYTIVASSRGASEYPARKNSNSNSNIKNHQNSGFSSFSVCETSPNHNGHNNNNNIRCARIINPGNNYSRKKSSRLFDLEQSSDSIFDNKNSKLPSVSESSKRIRQPSGLRVNILQGKETRNIYWAPAGYFEERDGSLIFGREKSRSVSKLPSSLPEKNGKDSSGITGRLFPEGKTAQISRDNNGIFATGLPESYRTNGDLRRSPSSTTLPSSWKKPARVGVKKSVSFSSDTSFQEKKLLFSSKTHVHEAKVYHKGVLQDRVSPTRIEGLRDSVGTSPSPTATTTTTTTNIVSTTPGGPSALLKAAREGNNFTLRQIMARAKNSLVGNSSGGYSSREMNINAVDSSGRTAISYMACNGAAAMVEAALTFPDIDVNLPDNEGNTPLHFAAQAGQLECVSILLQRCSSIEIDARNSLGFTPLMKAALQGRTKCAKILLFAGANPTLRDYGRGLRAEQWARFCGRYVCAEVIERFARHRLLERTTSCRWGSEPELAARVLQGKVTPMPTNLPPQSSGLRSKIRRVFRTSSGPDNRSFSLVSQLTSAALCASSPALPRQGEVPPVVKSLIRPLSVPQLRITLVAAPSDCLQQQQQQHQHQQQNPGTLYRSTSSVVDKYQTNFTEKIASEKIDSSVTKPPRSKKKNK